MAYLPPLWFRVMDPKVLASAISTRSMLPPANAHGSKHGMRDSRCGLGQRLGRRRLALCHGNRASVRAVLLLATFAQSCAVVRGRRDPRAPSLADEKHRCRRATRRARKRSNSLVPRAIVYLERNDGIYLSRRPADRHDRQQGYQFRPGIAAVQTGGQVSFPNRDEEFHSVFSYSSPKKFDLGRFRKDEDSPPSRSTGLVKICCEIHKHMRNLLLVLDTPWFTSTDTDGAFELAGVPAGEYRIKALLPSEETLQSRVTVVDGNAVQISLAR
jgi:plastocyanin